MKFKKNQAITFYIKILLCKDKAEKNAAKFSQIIIFRC